MDEQSDTGALVLGLGHAPGTIRQLDQPHQTVPTPLCGVDRKFEDRSGEVSDVVVAQVG